MVESSKAFSEGSVGIYIEDKFLKSVLPFRNFRKCAFEGEWSRSSYRRQDEMTGQLLRERLLPLTASSQLTGLTKSYLHQHLKAQRCWSGQGHQEMYSYYVWGFWCRFSNLQKWSPFLTQARVDFQQEYQNCQVFWSN